jgi:hypothetical protein
LPNVGATYIPDADVQGIPTGPARAAISE